ncbi:MAG: CsgG/HfaB family protein [Campylobacterota bacterium]|nr:CsgG/HfaB family protein [Campylobacterota bacterium]
MFKLFLAVLIAVFISGCAQKIKIRSLEPAEIDRATTTKKITVAEFKNDRVGLSGKIEANLAGHKIDGRSFFTIVSRNDFDKIIVEQKIQNSGLIDTSTVVEVGQLIDAQAIILGNVGRATSQDSYFYEERSRCVDKKCKERISYKVNCTKRVVGLSAELRMVDVARGDIIYADRLSELSKHKHCSDDSNALPSREIASQRLAAKIANSFTYKLTPHYRSFKVTLLEDADLDYSDKQERLLELSLVYIEQGRYDKAEKFLVELIDSTDKQSYVPFYNLGVVKEAQGQFREAKQYYKKADDLMIEPVKEISLASLRIERIICKHNKSKEQLQR